MLEREFLLGVSDRVWINNRPVPPGTYYRCRTAEDPGNRPCAFLKRHDGTEINIYLPVTPVHIEVHPHPTPTDIQKPQSELLWTEKYNIPERFSPSDN